MPHRKPKGGKYYIIAAHSETDPDIIEFNITLTA
jgi:hypothetical protein